MPASDDGEVRDYQKGSGGKAAAAAVAAYGAYIFLGLKTPLPGRYQEQSDGLDVEIHRFTTADGLTLRLKRYANPGGVPVILAHGFGGNGFTFDLPRDGRNMAVHLAKEGFDVWISQFRGCGRTPYISDAGDWRHSWDHLAIYDVPAIVDGVTDTTGKRAFWIGHSMGGMVLYMYLQGARFSHGDAVVSDEDLLVSRHRKLFGAATLGSPSIFCWPRDDPGRKGVNVVGLRKYIEYYNNKMLAKEQVSPRVHRRGGRSMFFRRHPRLIMIITRSPLAVGTYHRSNTDKETTTCLTLMGRSDVSAGMWVQRLQSLLEGDLIQHPPSTPGTRPYNYADNMPKITLPILFITGEKDYSPAGVKSSGYDSVASEMKKFVNLRSYGHIDLLMGSNVEKDVFPLISDWIKELQVIS
jgi:pimeloyl-ACP methyl ester carboxylesterase